MAIVYLFGIFLFYLYIRNQMGFDFSELVKRIVKYLVMGLVIAVVSIVIPKKTLNVEEIVILALSAAATFSILDVFLPTVSESARNGLGFGVGLGLSPIFV
jgi:ABC-type Co2+ transport system permease subunit